MGYLVVFHYEVYKATMSLVPIPSKGSDLLCEILKSAKNIQVSCRRSAKSTINNHFLNTVPKLKASIQQFKRETPALFSFFRLQNPREF